MPSPPAGAAMLGPVGASTCSTSLRAASKSSSSASVPAVPALPTFPPGTALPVFPAFALPLRCRVGAPTAGAAAAGLPAATADRAEADGRLACAGGASLWAAAAGSCEATPVAPAPALFASPEPSAVLLACGAGVRPAAAAASGALQAALGGLRRHGDDGTAPALSVGGPAAMRTKPELFGGGGAAPAEARGEGAIPTRAAPAGAAAGAAAVIGFDVPEATPHGLPGAAAGAVMSCGRPPPRAAPADWPSCARPFASTPGPDADGFAAAPTADGFADVPAADRPAAGLPAAGPCPRRPTIVSKPSASCASTRGFSAGLTAGGATVAAGLDR
jgi:hypothetical protein